MELEKINKEVAATEKSISRQESVDFKSFLSTTEGAFEGDSEVCPLKHYFADGTYTREMFMPKGVVLSGKIHSHKHTNILMEGAIDVVSDGELRTIIAPCIWVSEAGSQRTIRALEDTVFVNIHHNVGNSTDLEEIEKNVISESFEDFDKLIDKKKGLTYKLKNLVIKKLSE